MNMTSNCDLTKSKH